MYIKNITLQKTNKIQPVILSGGSGTRLWPLSRENFPKQYIKLNSSSSFSFLQKTQQRLQEFKNLEDPIIICNEQHRFIVAEQMREIKIKPKSIILEPLGRNTAPAIAIAALFALEEDEESILLILSSDHEIKNINNFRKTVEAGIEEATREKLITFGIKPLSPETGYGYIETEENYDEMSTKPLKIKRFIEKPNIKKAKDLFSKKNNLWNSGIFLFNAKLIKCELKKYEPDLLKNCKLALLNSSKDMDFLRIDKNYFKNCPNLSIDNAVMENTNKANVIPLKAGWNDVGNWHAIWDIEEKDNNQNTVIGDVYVNKVQNSYLSSKNKLLVAIGIKNLIVVQTDDATLVANFDQSQDIKNIVNKLNQEGRSEGKIHRKVFRPWGFYKLIEKGLTWQVKEICVKPLASLSLQKHNKRSEHWIILSGIASVQINDQKIILHENQSTYIPQGTKHRLSNLENDPLTIIEVQSGKYLGEDDIIRYDDKYGRLNR